MRTEFLETIYKEIGFLPGYKRRQVMAYFNELFAGCGNDEELISSLGTPEDALRKYLNSAKITSKIPKPLFIAAILVLSPFIVNIALAVSILAVILLIFAVILLFIIPVLGISLWLDGIEIIFRSIPQAVILADKLWQIGIGFILFAAGIALIVLVYRLYSKLIPWILGRFSALYNKIRRRTK